MEDTRMAKLRSALAKTLDGAIGSVKLEDFLQCFPDLVQTHEAVLTELFHQLVGSVRPNVMVRPLALPWTLSADGRLVPVIIHTLSQDWPAREPDSRTRIRAQQEFEQICEEFDLVGKLNQLDEAYGSGSEISSLATQVAGVSPEDQMRDIRIQIKLKERDELKAVIANSEQECGAARERLALHRAKVLEMEQSIQGASQQLTEVRRIFASTFRASPVAP
jgi:hypothetical protein